MSLPFDPKPGTVVICDFRGFVEPEMVKPRLCVVISPRRRDGVKLCTVVPLSTTVPYDVKPYHRLLTIDPPLPRFDSPTCWLKGDMVYTLSYDRMNLPFSKDRNGGRTYHTFIFSKEEIANIRSCVVRAMGIMVQSLTGVG